MSHSHPDPATDHTLTSRALAARVLLAAAIVALATAGAAGAATFSCGSDAVQNTAAILCSGTSECTDTAVIVNENIDVLSGECVFDLGGRDVTFTKTFQVDGVTGSIEVDNAGDVAIADTGKLKARGDFPARSVPSLGGRITLFAAGTIEHGGIIDASGNDAGKVRLVAGGGVTLLGNSEIVANGISNPDAGEHFADGGEIVIESTTGSVAVDGFIDLIGDSQARGGTLHIEAAGSISIGKAVEATGGDLDGGTVELIAGDDVTVTKTIDVDSTTDGGFGGSITIHAGADALGGSEPGGGVDVEAPLSLNGSSSDTSGGGGGTLSVTAAGDIRFVGANVSIHANAGASFDGSGGHIVFNSGDGNPHVLGPLDGDIVLGGIVTTRGGSTGGDGGTITLTAGKDLFFDADTEMHGKDSGGDFEATAGAMVTINRELAADATNVAGRGGNISFVAGLAQNAGLTLKEDITVEAMSGLNGNARKITLAGCSMTIEKDTRIDVDADTAVGAGQGGTIELISRTPIQILAKATFFARPGGTIMTTHPPGQDPIIGASTVFNPARTDNPVADGPYPNCAVCGDGVLQLGEVCDRGLDPCCNQTCSASDCSTPTPTPTVAPGQLGLADPAAAKAADKCQRAITKAGTRFVGQKLALLASCSDGLFKCIQTKPEADGKRAQCLAKARASCDTRLRKIAAAELTLTTTIEDTCAGPGRLADLLAPRGLAFANMGSDCGALTSVADVADCVVTQHGCRADELFGRAAPRARELMRVAGVAPDAVAPLHCLVDNGGSGLDLDQESAAGKQIATCAKGITKAADSFATRSLAGLEKCVNKVFTCAQTRPNDVTACVVPKVADKCRAEFARFEAGKIKLRNALTKSCGGLSFASLLAVGEGMNLATVDCGAPTLPEFADCLIASDACRVAQLLRVGAPRTDELLDKFGLALPTGSCVPN